MIEMKKIILLMFLLLLSSQLAKAQNPNPDLKIGKPVRSSIRLNEQHVYRIAMANKQFALLNLKQQGIDLKIETFAPDGFWLEEFDSPNNEDGNELILIDANREGSFEIRVSPLAEEKKIKSGDYEIELIGIHSSIETHLTEVLKKLNSRGHIPGFALSVVNAKKVLYQNAMGLADVRKELPYSIETVHNIASISKTFIGLSIMKLVEQGKLTLDTSINDLLPFKITNPYYPKKDITLRHLATHTATINEQGFYHKAYILLDEEALDKYEYHKHFLKELNMAKKNQRRSLPEFLKAHLSPEGEHYRKKNFFKKEPGQNWYYSNVGAALAAYIVEQVSGEDYKVFVRKHIIDPLELESAAWKDEIDDRLTKATQYDSKGNPLPDRTIITYADGGMHINVSDLSKYLMQFIKGNAGEDGILSSASMKELMKVQHEQIEGRFKGRRDGLFWEYSSSGVMGHSGGDYGVSAFMYFDPVTNLGYTYVCNIMPTESDYSNAQSRSTWAVLKRYARYFE